MQCRPCLDPPPRYIIEPRFIIEAPPFGGSAQAPFPPLAPPHAAVFRALGARLESLGQSLTLYAGRQKHDQAQVRALLDALDPLGAGSQVWDWTQILEEPVLGPSCSRKAPAQPPPPAPAADEAAATPPMVGSLPARNVASAAAEVREVEQKLDMAKCSGDADVAPGMPADFGRGLVVEDGHDSATAKVSKTAEVEQKLDMTTDAEVDEMRGAKNESPCPLAPSRSSVFPKKKPPPPFMQKMDAFIGAVIMLNALVMAVSLDIDPLWGGWQAFEYCFLSVFFFEVVLKLRTFGALEYFLGGDCHWNIFDTFLVSFGIFEVMSTIIAEITGEGSSTDMGGFVRMVKIVRLTRVARLVRLLRYKIFTELKAMVLGVFSGLRVLFWAILLFFAFIFLIAIILRSSVGQNEEFMDTFGRMPWAVFTLFRCFTDGCAAHDGTPLQVRLYARYGAWFALSYMACFLFVTIGLFNLIMAVFVDNVMDSTSKRRQLERAEDAEDVERCLRELVQSLLKRDQAALTASLIEHSQIRTFSISAFCRKLTNWIADFFRKTPVSVAVERAANRHSGVFQAVGDIDEIPDANVDVIITPEIFDAWLAVAEFRAMLEVLEISSLNPRELFDVLDSNMSGELCVEELVMGLMNLRGPAEKSYTVASLLCTRVVQQMLREYVAESDERHASILLALQDSSRDAQRPAQGASWAPPANAQSLGLSDVD